MGNIRVSYAFNNAAGQAQIMEENHYYPFGLKHKKYGSVDKDFVEIDDETGYFVGIDVVPPLRRKPYQYKYNHREFQDELDLNVTAMDFRQYDNALGRFHNMDRLAELAPGISPYRFAFNNPNYWSDPTGLFENWYDAINYALDNNISGTIGYSGGDNGLYYINSGTGITAQSMYMIDENLVIGGTMIEGITIGNGNGGGGFGGNGGFDGVGGSGFGGNGGFDGVGSSMAGFNFGFGGEGINGYLQTTGLMYSSVGAYGERAFKKGSYTQTNGNKGNFQDRPYKKLSQNAKSNYNFSKDLGKLSKAGTIVSAGAIAYDFLDDGNIKTSSVVNGTLLAISLFFPPTAGIVLAYTVADYFFDFSGKIDNRFGEINTGIYD